MFKNIIEKSNLYTLNEQKKEIERLKKTVELQKEQINQILDVLKDHKKVIQNINSKIDDMK